MFDDLYTCHLPESLLEDLQEAAEIPVCDDDAFDGDSL